MFLALVVNMTPLVIAILSYIILRERMSCMDILVLIISFVGVIVLIFGSINNETKQNEGEE